MKNESTPKARSTAKLKVLIADTDRLFCRRVADFLMQNGFETRMVHTGADVRVSLINWSPDHVLIDLLLPSGNAFDTLNYKQNNPSLKKKDISFIVMSSHTSKENLEESFARGARDYIQKPFLYPDLLNRIVLQSRAKDETVSVDDLTLKGLKANWELLEEVLDQAGQADNIEKTFFELAKTVSKKTNSVRCSFVRVVTQNQGAVMASSDDVKVAGLQLDLMKYPEIQVVMNTGKMIAIENLENSKALKKIKTDIKSINFNSMIVCPILYRGKPFGVISVRLKDGAIKIREEDIHFVGVVGKIASLALNASDLSKMTKFGLISA